MKEKESFATLHQSKKTSKKPDIRNEFIFRMWDLQVVLCFLGMIGKLMDISGLDEIPEKAGK